MFFTKMPSPLGEIILTSDGTGLTGVYLPGNSGYENAAEKTENNSAKPFTEALKQLSEYFSGKRKDFDLPLAAEGSNFQKQVWGELLNIACGETKNYGQIAKALKHEKASRAVGAANGRNPIAIIVPCHRVVGSNGKLTGYNGGVDKKKWLLEHERRMSA